MKLVNRWFLWLSFCILFTVYQICMAFVCIQKIVSITLILIIILNHVNKGNVWYELKHTLTFLLQNLIKFLLFLYRFGICCVKVMNATSNINQNILSRNLTYIFEDIENDLFNISIVLKPEFLDISFFRLDFSEINYW